MTLADWGAVAAIIAVILPAFTWVLRNVITSVVRKENDKQAKKQNDFIELKLNALMVNHLDRHHGTQSPQRRR